MGIKENLKSKRKELGYTLEDVAVQIGIKRSTLQRYESGMIANIPSDKIEKLAEIYQTTPAQLMNWDFSPRTDSANVLTEIFSDSGKEFTNILPIINKRYPLLGAISCGEPTFTSTCFEGYVEAGSAVQADFCLRARGDSMINARINNGDIVFIRKQTDVDEGEIAAVIINDEAMLKRVFKHNDFIQLQAENPHVKPILYRKDDNANIRIIGKAVAFQSDIV